MEEALRSEDGEAVEYEVPAVQGSSRADKVLAAAFPQHSRAFLQKLFEAGLVWRESEILTKKAKVTGGELLSFTVPATRPLELRPVNIPLRVLFEDGAMIAVDKAPGMVVHPGAGTGEDTLVHALLHHCEGQLAGIGGVERPGIVHRLDKETSGVIVAAKSERAFRALSEMFAERALRKFYSALVLGTPEPPVGEIRAAIGRHSVHRTRMCVREDGRFAHTDYEVAETAGGASLVHCRIHTGRTHQIRVHLAHLGCPLLGDETYGFRANRLPGVAVPRVMLHARRLELTHPVSGEELTLEAPLPEDFSGVLGQLREGA